MSVTQEDIKELAELEARLEVESLGCAIESALRRIVERTTAVTCSGVVRPVAFDGSKGEEGIEFTVSFDASEARQWMGRVSAALEAGDLAEAWRLCKEEGDV